MGGKDENREGGKVRVQLVREGWGVVRREGENSEGGKGESSEREGSLKGFI